MTSKRAVEPAPGVLVERLMRTAGLRKQVEQWLIRNGWSFATAADLVEAAMRERFAPGMEDAAARVYAAGEMVVHRGHVWRAKRRVMVKGRGGEVQGPRLRAERYGETASGWQHVMKLRACQHSHLNALVRGHLERLNVDELEGLGVLNEYLARVEKGRSSPPEQERLKQACVGVFVLEDEMGVWGPEEFLGLQLGRLEPIECAIRGEEDGEGGAAVG